MRRSRRRRRRRQLRGSLRKVLFVWFLMALAASAAAGAVAFRAFGGSGMPPSGAEEFVARRFERVWDSPAERQALADDLARIDDLRVVVDDGGGAVADEDCRRAWTVPVGNGLGSVYFCRPSQSPGRITFAALVALTVLLFMSGALAHRLSAPMRRIAGVAGRLADGEFDARVGPMRGRGEAALLGRAFDQMAERLSARLQEQQSLLAHVSHELRTPLGHLRLLLGIGREGGDVDWDELERELEELDELVGQLLARSRLNLKADERRASDPVALARRALQRQGVHAEVVDAFSGSIFELDASLTERALANLVRNAEQHGQGLRRLVVRGDAATLTFELLDGGEGFELDETPASGLGLGLPLVAAIAKAHGGELTTETLADGFVVRLRFTQGPARPLAA
ncbi:MAG: HAMP domain-containing sensor histidine kinase [Myxococcota bacterium]